MVFSSLPLYHIDPPIWPQVDERSGNGSVSVVVEQQSGVGGGGGGTAARPNSMAERARQAKIPQPESALKCPRCESTNTKFCYFNNYSLSQPRHFCKTCRRYWTRGGALRNVPVGGGCRRNNKRTKSSNPTPTPTTTSRSSKSPLNNNPTLAHASVHDSIFHAPHLPPQLPILPSLGELGGSSFGGIGQSSGGVLLSNGIVEQWRLQQFPLGLDSGGGLFYSSESGGGGVKMEGNGVGVNLSRNFMGISGNEIGFQYNNNNNAWNDHHHHGLSGFTPSSTTHLL